MIAFGLTLATFAAFTLVGLALLVVIGAETANLRVVLTAPILGFATAVLPLFLFSHAGVSMENCSIPIVALLLIAAVGAIAWRRPSLPLAALPVAVVCVIALFLQGWPMFQFGFDWISNANDDMANYVLSATQLLHHGLLAPLNAVGLSQDRDYATTLQTLHTIGSRPGADITLAALSRITGRAPYETFMPLILALNLCTVAAVGALAMQAAKRWWAATVAAALIAVSPLATYGALQELLPQVAGLGLAAALFALLMREELYRKPGARIQDLVPIGVLVTAIVLVYVEAASALVVAYAVYVGILVLRRKFDLRAAARLWIPPVAIAAVLLNTYLIREVQYLGNQAASGLHGRVAGSPFGFSLVPAALTAIVGLQHMAAVYSTPHLALTIVIAVILLAGAGVACVFDARRGGAASTVLVGFGILGIVLGVHGSDFGLFKLYMYIQPFLAAGVAVWIASIPGKRTLVVAGIALALLAVDQSRIQRVYVNASRSPIDLHEASSKTLLPAFRKEFAATDLPVVSVTENPILVKLEAASIGKRRLFFINAEIFQELAGGYATWWPESLKRSLIQFKHLDAWDDRYFNLHEPGGKKRTDPFRDNTHATALLESGKCMTIVPTGSQLTLNRRSLPEGLPNLIASRCGDHRNLLVFTNSTLGENFYFYHQRTAISFYQLEQDYFYPGHTFSGYGRYSLFRVLGPTKHFRLEIDLSTTLRQDGSNRLPPASVVGLDREGLPLTGRGSARVFSAPIKPQMIAGQPYILLDIGENGRILPDPRPGVQGLWAKNVPLDPRYLTSYVRDVSLITDAEYRTLHAPSVLRHFPADLGNHDLEYSGMYEDGWVGESSYAMLAGGRAADLIVNANVLPAAKHLQVLVDGHRVYSKSVAAGALALRFPVPASKSRRRLELRWGGSTKLGPTDPRHASALLTTIGFVPVGSQ